MNIRSGSGMKSYLTCFMIFVFALLISSCSSTIKLETVRTGDIETVVAKDGSDIAYKLIYTYSGSQIVKGEHWLPVEEDKEIKDSNLLANTAIAKKFNKILHDEGVEDDLKIEIGKEADNMMLNFVQLVTYNTKGQPVKVRRRGRTSIPVVGTFNLKTDLTYKYDKRDNLILATERNLNVDTLLLNFAIGNITAINRDFKGRPTNVIKTIGSVPPLIENTKYLYKNSNDPFMDKTTYEKIGLDGLSLKRTETITFWYRDKVSWKGMDKYSFSLKEVVRGFSIWDNVKNISKLDGSNFANMNPLQQGLFVKNIYDLIQMEYQGPTWRMGFLPDVPQPFLIYEDFKWFN